jgi:hypothetical protein
MIDGDATIKEFFDFAMTMVKEWDFTDVETGEPREVGCDPGLLSRKQVKEVTRKFQKHFRDWVDIT